MRNLETPQAIADAFGDYYSDLYNLQRDPDTHQSSSEDIHEFLQHIRLPSLTSEQLSQLNDPFTEQEIIVTIKTLHLGKAPGPDGLTGEYFKQFAQQLAPHLTALFNDMASSSKFPSESLQALITLPKPGKEPTAPKMFAQSRF